MTYRIVCDENVAPQTATYLERDGHNAVHIRDLPSLGLGSTDPDIAVFAVEDDRAILTNDKDFLDTNQYPDQTILFYVNNRATAYELADMISRLQTYYPTQDDLPQQTFLSGSGN